MTNTTPKRSVITTDEYPNGPGGSPSISVQIADKGVVMHRGSAFSQLIKESYLTSEYCLISSQPKLGGIYVIPSQRSPTLWFGVIFVHNGPYLGGVFRFTITFHEGFPENGLLPTVTFNPPIFHPSISANKGVFDLRKHFKHGWSRTHNHVWQIVKILRSSFYKLETSYPVNKQAYEMLFNHETFVKRAQQEVESSLAQLYDNPPEEYKDAHYIRFSPYDPSLHDNLRAKALKPILSFRSPSTNCTNTISSLNYFTPPDSSVNNSNSSPNTSSSSSSSSRASISPGETCFKRGFSWLKDRFKNNGNLNKTI